MQIYAMENIESWRLRIIKSASGIETESSRSIYRLGIELGMYFFILMSFYWFSLEIYTEYSRIHL